jgi:hypothetical protein
MKVVQRAVVYAPAGSARSSRNDPTNNFEPWHIRRRIEKQLTYSLLSTIYLTYRRFPGRHLKFAQKLCTILITVADDSFTIYLAELEAHAHSESISTRPISENGTDSLGLKKK